MVRFPLSLEAQLQVAQHGGECEMPGMQLLADLRRFGVEMSECAADLCPLPVDPRLVLLLLIAVIYLKIKTGEVLDANKKRKTENEAGRFQQYLGNLDSRQIETLLNLKQEKNSGKKSSGSSSAVSRTGGMLLILLFPTSL